MTIFLPSTTVSLVMLLACLIAADGHLVFRTDAGKRVAGDDGVDDGGAVGRGLGERRALEC